MTFNFDIGIEDLGPYQVHTRREILTLLRSIGERNQLVRMIFNDGSEAVVTSILKIDEASNTVLIDCAPGQLQNQRILESGQIAFETTLERIRILFFVDSIEICQHEGMQALRIDLPTSVVRLQRREFYRVITPRCTIQIAHGTSQKMNTVTVPVQNVSAGGVGLVDEAKVLDNTVGRIYQDCRIALPGGVMIVSTLEVRNSQDTTLLNGKLIRRMGCLFVDLPKPMMALVQRYITKLEREQNAKSAGMG